ncbi:MAG: protein-disulfide reductase DsbD N-terminal domain-containing protein, partial [Flammeovirgaceae bacterium]
MRFFAFGLIFIANTLCTAQVLTPAKWNYSTSAQTVKVGDEIDLIFNATIDNNWYLYSSEFNCEDGPIKTSFSFTPDASYQLVGSLRAINPIDKHDKIFECDVKIFKKTAEFRQRVKVFAKNLKITGEFEYQVCTEITGQCVPGNGEFLFDNSKLEVRGSKLESGGSKLEARNSN